MAISLDSLDRLKSKIRENESKIKREQEWCTRTRAEIDTKQQEVEKTERLIETLQNENSKMEREFADIQRQLQEIIAKK